MKKVIGIVLVAIFLTTGIAAATDFTLSGSYYARGQWHDNVTGEGEYGQAYAEYADDKATMLTELANVNANGGKKAEAYGNFDHELSIDATWQIDDATKVFARFEMRDQNWNEEGAKDEDTNHTDADDNIVVERVWGSHKFAATGGTLTVGLMSGGTWGTKFFDTEYDAYRIKYIQPTTIGSLVGVYQKAKEAGAAYNDTYEESIDDDEQDTDLYILGLIAKLGDINVRPIFIYADVENLEGKKMVGMLSLSGNFGDFSFEAEFDYETADLDKAKIDYDIYGAYAKISYATGPATIGVLGAYGSYDDDADAFNKGFSFGDDFEAGGAMILGDDMELVDADLGAGYLVATTLSYTVSEKLTLSGYLGYWEANDDYIKDKNSMKGVTPVATDANAYEISAQGAYAITANLTYSFGLAWAELDIKGLKGLDDSFQAYHKLAFSF